MDSNQPRPVTPQPPQGGSGSGFSAILTVFLSFIAIFVMVRIIYQTISTLNTMYKYSTATALFFIVIFLIIITFFLIDLIYFNSVCFSIWSLTFSALSIRSSLDLCFAWFDVKYDLLAKLSLCLSFNNWSGDSSCILLSKGTHTSNSLAVFESKQ